MFSDLTLSFFILLLFIVLFGIDYFAIGLKKIKEDLQEKATELNNELEVIINSFNDINNQNNDSNLEKSVVKKAVVAAANNLSRISNDATITTLEEVIKEAEDAVEATKQEGIKEAKAANAANTAPEAAPANAAVKAKLMQEM